MVKNKDWLFELINLYRNDVKTPTDINGFELNTGFDLRPPLQISILWFESEINNIQFFLISHSKEFPDKQINIFGPFKIQNKIDIENFETILNTEKLFKHIKDDQNENLIDDLKERLFKITQNNIKLLANEPRNAFGNSGVFYDMCHYIIYEGNIFNNSITKIIQAFHKTKEISRNLYIMHKELPLKYEMIPFFAGYILPPIWFGEYPKLSITDNLKGKKLRGFIKRIYEGEIAGKKIIIENDGYMGIAINDNRDGQFENKELYDTIKILNFFFGIILLKGYKIQSIQTSDFSYTTYLPKSGYFTQTYRNHSKSEKLFKERNENLKIKEFIKARNKISTDELKKIIDNTNKLIQYDKIIDLLGIFIQSYSNLSKNEIIQSFILSWTLIEEYLNYIWESLLEGKNISNSKRIDKLKGRDFTASIISEILNITGNIDNNELKILNRLRKKRNAFMHDLKPINYKIAVESFDLALNYLQKRIKKLL
ncbi:MAG: TM1812 family CRISPR-associated protein [Candidatus Lokiarchaeota archaeon]|nr:TM1812 family CRISPR-associated protein [Candidatus Lokiarchaeota archaeon]